MHVRRDGRALTVKQRINVLALNAAARELPPLLTAPQKPVAIIEEIPLNKPDFETVRAIKAMISLGDQKAEQALTYYREAGQYLRRLRDSNKKTFGEIVRAHCDLSLSRAYELMRIADATPLARAS